MTFLLVLGIVVLAVCGLLARQYLMWRAADALSSDWPWDTEEIR